MEPVKEIYLLQAVYRAAVKGRGTRSASGQGEAERCAIATRPPRSGGIRHLLHVGRSAARRVFQSPR
jgi:hypothetical protein